MVENKGNYNYKNRGAVTESNQSDAAPRLQFGVDHGIRATCLEPLCGSTGLTPRRGFTTGLAPLRGYLAGYNNF